MKEHKNRLLTFKMFSFFGDVCNYSSFREMKTNRKKYKKDLRNSKLMIT